MSHYLGNYSSPGCTMSPDFAKNMSKDELELEENEDARSTSASSEGGNGGSSSESSSGTELDTTLTLVSANYTVDQRPPSRFGSLWAWVYCRRRAPQPVPCCTAAPQCVDHAEVRVAKKQEVKLRNRAIARPQSSQRACQRSKPARTTQAKASTSFMKEHAFVIPPPPGLSHTPAGQACIHEPALPLRPPPGIRLGGKCQFSSNSLRGFQPPPGLPPPADVPHKAPEYSIQGFRREAANILRELKLHRNVGLAVSQVRLQGVPQDRQAAEYVDLLTMVLEETRGPARRVCVAFIGGLTKAFEVEQCISGLRAFFSEIYEDLRNEVPDLSKRVASELLPTLNSVVGAKDLELINAPQDLRNACNL